MDKVKKTVQDNPKNRIEYEIGDFKSAEWQPQIKFMRWDNEVNLSVRQVSEGTPNFYDVEEGHEFEIIWDEKPVSNKVHFTLETKGLDFFYQRELTPEEIAEGASRPDNVIGSYAVYHKTKGGMNRADGMDYKVGKAFHIYRPYAEDVNGMGVWCDLKITGANMTITVPQDFLDTAVYPVTVDPTFGYTSNGASEQSVTNTLSGYRFTLSENGTVTKLTGWITNRKGSSDSSGRTMGVYLQSDSSKKINSNENTQSLSNGVDTEVDFTLPSSVDLTAADYYIAATAAFISNGLRVNYDTGDTAYYQERAWNPYNTTLPDPAAFTSSSNEKLSLYATYTAAGGGPLSANISDSITATESATVSEASNVDTSTNKIYSVKIT